MDEARCAWETKSSLPIVTNLNLEGGPVRHLEAADARELCACAEPRREPVRDAACKSIQAIPVPKDSMTSDLCLEIPVDCIFNCHRGIDRTCVNSRAHCPQAKNARPPEPRSVPVERGFCCPDICVGRFRLTRSSPGFPNSLFGILLLRSSRAD